MFRRVGGGLPRLARVWADAAYRALADWARANVRWVLDIVTRRDGAVGFEVQPWRWVVERTFGWFVKYRRLAPGSRCETLDHWRSVRSLG